MATFAATIGTLGALWGVSHLVDRETKQRHEAFSAKREQMYQQQSTNKTIVSDGTLVAERPVPSADRWALHQVPPTQTGNKMSRLPASRQTDEVLFRARDATNSMPSRTINYYRTKQKQFWAPKQEREGAPSATVGNVKQTTPLMTNQSILDRNTVSKGGPAGIGSSTGVQIPGRIWEIEAIGMERDKVKQTKMWMPPADSTFVNTRSFITPAFNFTPHVGNAPTFLEPRFFDRQDNKINRPTKTCPESAISALGVQVRACEPKRDRTYTKETGVVYKQLVCSTSKGHHSAVELFTDDKEDHVLNGRNPGATRTPQIPRLQAATEQSLHRRKLEQLSNRGLSVPHVPKGTYAQANAASKLFTVYRKKREDLQGPKPAIGRSSAVSQPAARPGNVKAAHKSTKAGEQQPYATANPKYTAPDNIADSWTKAASRGVADFSSKDYAQFAA